MWREIIREEKGENEKKGKEKETREIKWVVSDREFYNMINFIYIYIYIIQTRVVQKNHLTYQLA